MAGTLQGFPLPDEPTLVDGPGEGAGGLARAHAQRAAAEIDRAAALHQLESERAAHEREMLAARANIEMLEARNDALLAAEVERDELRRVVAEQRREIGRLALAALAARRSR